MFYWLTTETGISLVGKGVFFREEDTIRPNTCIEGYIKTENSDREWLYLHSPCPVNEIIKCTCNELEKANKY